MKKLLVFSFVACLFTLSSMAQVERAYADSSKKNMRQKGAGKKDKRELMKELNLNRDQIKQIRALNQETKAKMEAVKALDKITAEEKKTKMKAIQEERKTKLKAILTADQYAKMEAKIKEKIGKKGNADVMDDLEN
jgi:Spy/CpxP family protein refolding chaperone